LLPILNAKGVGGVDAVLKAPPNMLPNPSWNIPQKPPLNTVTPRGGNTTRAKLGLRFKEDPKRQVEARRGEVLLTNRLDTTTLETNKLGPTLGRNRGARRRLAVRRNLRHKDARILVKFGIGDSNLVGP
jgi:hypothetical protein